MRAAGGGRRKLVAKDATLLSDLDALVEPTTRGDPQSALRWTCKSTTRLARYADAIALGQVSDGLILVLEADSTRKKAAQMAAANLRSSNVPILGAVLNKRTFPIPEKIYKRL